MSTTDSTKVNPSMLNPSTKIKFQYQNQQYQGKVMLGLQF